MPRRRPPRARRCLIFNPYLHVLGGGERYTVALGDAIAKSHEVTYAAPYRPDPHRAEQLGFPALDVLCLTEHEFPRVSAEFDLAVVIELHVPPRSFATRSVVMVQFPLEQAAVGNPVRRFMIRSKLRRYRYIVNSIFTREWLLRRWNVGSDILHPAVELADDCPVPKDKLILAVGRFMEREADQWNSKRQDVLIAAFSQLPRGVRDEWRLVLAGGCFPSPEMDEYLESLRQKAEGLNVSLEVNVPPARLAELQQKARLFWHATGFERPASEPERAEHFGISTVEAMSNRSIPLVFADGGQVEIVTEECGRLWRTIPELVERTTELAQAPPEQLDALGAAARTASIPFGAERFEVEANAFLGRIGALRQPRRRLPRAVALRSRRARWRLHRVATVVYESCARRYNLVVHAHRRV